MTVPGEPLLRPREINARGMALQSAGRIDEALTVFREAVNRYPNEASIANNFAFTLDEAGAHDEALAAYRDAVRLDPTLWAAEFGAANILLRQQAFAESAAAFERVVALEPDFVPARWALYELLQIVGDTPRALVHQRAALDHQQLFSRIAPAQKRSVLALMGPGDWQANVPVDMLFAPEGTTLHKLYLLDEQQVKTARLPAHDVVFNCIGESDAARETLRLAGALLARTERPVLNTPAAVANTNRVTLAEKLKSLDLIMPRTLRVPRADLLAGNLPLPLPALLRPVGSHAGRDLELIADEPALQTYVQRVVDGDFYQTEFVDYRKADGFFRKYRVIVIDGVPYPFHLAISPHWLVHYYNSPMAENQWMRDEEATFLEDFDAVFTPAQRNALQAIATALELDYFGIDCSIDAAGNLVVFEADPAIIVHLADPIDLYPYKHRAVPRIFAAVEALVDSRVARSR